MQDETSTLKLASQYISENRRDEAIKIIVPLLKQQSQNPQAWYLAAQLTGDETRKKQYLERAAELELAQKKLAIQPIPSTAIKEEIRNSPEKIVSKSDNKSGLSTLLLTIIAVSLIVIAFATLSLLNTSQMVVKLALVPTYTLQPTYTNIPTFTPQPTFTSIPTFTPRPTLTELPDIYMVQKYEYVILSYTQYSALGGGSVVLALGSATDKILDEELFLDINRCIASEKDLSFFLPNNCTPRSPALSNLLNKVGAKGWEVTGVIDKSNESSFSVEIYLKRLNSP
jgi:hypothetical protein